MSGDNSGDDCMETDPVPGYGGCSSDLVRSLASLSVVNGSRKHTGVEKGERGKASLNLHPCSGRRETVEPLDEELWSSLPEHLHDIILAWLPLPSFFRLRCVCKRWNDIINVKSFLSVCSRVPSQGSLFLMFTDMLQQKFAAYDPTTQRWHMLPHSFFLPCPYFESVLVATAGGLLCFQGTGAQNRYLSVSNPMTRTQRKLPPMLNMKSPYVVGMVMDREHQTYKILVVPGHQDGDSLTSQVYDSRTNSWYMASSLPRRVALITGTAFINGYLYSMSFGATAGVLAFDVHEGTWHELKVRMSQVVCPQLIGHRGQLLMVGGVEEYGTLRSVHLWRLDMARSEWLEVQCMPDTLFNTLFKSQHRHFLCFSHGDYVCFTESSSREMLMYDMYRNSWWWLPVCTLNSNLQAGSVLGFSFEPRLDAQV
ncbi:hypothetical protein M758_4G252600 [Ceratodon purpureus]|uniref:F-box domain-containing protein n=1 Tax=Ceratodon purpureus TaxID=3225 RepID=A0A8T0IGD9_CERPU|nr:hypothetical protein KC19_4G265200 [Ceratodon purpureus]KAG0620888.1 hypothetical protein M758_4G252600 [Ceratodon purpureus]